MVLRYCSFDPNTERRAVTKQKGRKILTPSGRLKNVFSVRQLGLVLEETLVPSRRKRLQLLIGNKIENKRPASNYRYYRFILIRKQCGRRKITVITSVTVVTDFIENGIGKIMVGCSRCTYPSIHLCISRSRSVVRGAVVWVVCA